jgi:RNA polymerase sigma-70 factor (sigma-E family)
MDPEESGLALATDDLETVFARHRDGLFRLAVLLVGDEAEAEDVVQDAFAGLHRRWPRLRETGNARAYTRAAVVNGCRMLLRRRVLARRLGMTHEPPIWSAEEAVIVREDRREVMAALQRLPGRRREALVLRYYLDLDDAEIARTMGVSESSVRSTITRGLAALGNLLKEKS